LKREIEATADIIKVRSTSERFHIILDFAKFDSKFRLTELSKFSTLGESTCRGWLELNAKPRRKSTDKFLEKLNQRVAKHSSVDITANELFDWWINGWGNPFNLIKQNENDKTIGTQSNTTWLDTVDLYLVHQITAVIGTIAKEKSVNLNSIDRTLLGKRIYNPILRYVFEFQINNFNTKQFNNFVASHFDLLDA